MRNRGEKRIKEEGGEREEDRERRREKREREIVVHAQMTVQVTSSQKQ